MVVVVEAVTAVDRGIETEAEDEAEDEADESELDRIIPLQKPALQVLKAHCESLVQGDWKLPHLGISIEFTA